MKAWVVQVPSPAGSRGVYTLRSGVSAQQQRCDAAMDICTGTASLTGLSRNGNRAHINHLLSPATAPRLMFGDIAASGND